MAALKRFLVTGATGKQGGAVISALTASPPKPPIHIVALTRNPASPRAQALAKKPNISILQGDLDDCPSIFKDQEPFHSVFAVTTLTKSPKVEEQQGISLVNAAAANGVKHFVFTSADRGVNGDTDPTPVPHFQSKFNIEARLREVSATGGMQWTIIRPVAFMENLTPDFFGKGFATMWELNGEDRKLQLVSVPSVGMLAAAVLQNPSQYASKALPLATDSLSPNEAKAIFKRVVGKGMPTTYHFVGRLLKWMLHEQLGIMFKWFVDVGFGADPEEYRRQFPEMQNFETWLRESSGFKGQIVR